MLLARIIHFLLPSFLILPCWFSSDTTFLHSLQPLKREKCLDWHRLSPIVIGGRWSMNFHRSDGFLDFSPAGEIDNGSPPRLSSSSPVPRHVLAPGYMLGYHSYNRDNCRLVKVATGSLGDRFKDRFVYTVLWVSREQWRTRWGMLDGCWRDVDGG